MCRNMYRNMYIFMWRSMYIFKCRNMYRNMYIYEQKYVYIYVQKYVYLCTEIFIFTYTNIYIYVHKYVYIYYLVICKFVHRNVYVLPTGNPINSYIRIFKFGICKNTYFPYLLHMYFRNHFLGKNRYFIPIKISI